MNEMKKKKNTFTGRAPLASTCRPRRRKASHLGLSRDSNIQTRREVLGVRLGLGPAIPHLLSQIRDRNI